MLTSGVGAREACRFWLSDLSVAWLLDRLAGAASRVGYAMVSGMDTRLSRDVPRDCGTVSAIEDARDATRDIVIVSAREVALEAAPDPGGVNMGNDIGAGGAGGFFDGGSTDVVSPVLLAPTVGGAGGGFLDGGSTDIAIAILLAPAGGGAGGG